MKRVLLFILFTFVITLSSFSQKKYDPSQEKPSLFKRIGNWFKSIFSGGSQQEDIKKIPHSGGGIPLTSEIGQGQEQRVATDPSKLDPSVNIDEIINAFGAAGSGGKVSKHLEGIKRLIEAYSIGNSLPVEINIDNNKSVNTTSNSIQSSIDYSWKNHYCDKIIREDIAHPYILVEDGYATLNTKGDTIALEYGTFLMKKGDTLRYDERFRAFRMNYNRERIK